MAAKKKNKAQRQTVTVTIDADALRALIGAVDSLSEFAGAWATAVEDPALRSELTKKLRSKRR